MVDFDSIIVGAGFSGAVIARNLAEDGNKKVLVLDKRSHIGGNMYEGLDTNGVSVHWYGPHIFHTNDISVFDYLSRFSDWFPYEHRVLGKINEKLVPIPFNFHSLDLLFSPEDAKTLKEDLLSFFPNEGKVSILDLINHPNNTISKFGNFVYEKVFLNYTAKQWGTTPDNVDKSVINRVPVILGYDDRYFQDGIQFMPTNGYTPIFERMLTHPNITVQLDCNATEVIKFNFEDGEVYYNGTLFSGEFIFTGAIDELFDYRYGHLPYRSLNLVFEQKECSQFQPAAVVNYPNEEEFTRITEFKHLTNQQVKDATTILKEYPTPYDPLGGIGNIPYYVIENKENRDLYNQYEELTKSFKNIFLCGRLAEYKYYNMDQAIKRALEISHKILG